MGADRKLSDRLLRQRRNPDEIRHSSGDLTMPGAGARRLGRRWSAAREVRCFNQVLRIDRLTQKEAILAVKDLDLAASAELELQRNEPILERRNYDRLEGRGACDLFTGE